MTRKPFSHQRPPEESSALPPNYRRNFAALAIDYISFMVSFSFFNPNSVVPAFVRQLTTSAPVVGLSATIFRGCSLLPQTVFARLVSDKPRKKPYMLIGASGRVMILVIAVALWSSIARHPRTLLILFLVCLALFAATNGLTAVTWSDVMARAIPVRRRGRFIGMSQVIGGGIGFGVGGLVGLILGSPHYPFPYDYALLFTLASVAMVASVVAMTMVREPPAEGAGAQANGQAHGRWLRVLAADAAFRRLVACRTLIMMMDLATPFYVGHAEEVLHLPQSVVGGFVVAQVLGGIAAGALLGPISERWGPRYVVRIAGVSAIAGPALALVVHLAGGGWLATAYPLVYVAVGIVSSARLMGFVNYALEIAPQGMRSAYIGLGNTIIGVTTLVPALGGGLLEATSYTTLFALTTAIGAIGFVLSLALPPSQGGASVEGQH